MTNIFIPTLGRPERIPAIVNNIYDNTIGDYQIYFILEPNDEATRAVCTGLKQNFIINEEEACYAGAINTAYHKTQGHYFLTAADDLLFYPNWLPYALSHMKDGTQVVGTNDLGNIPIGTERNSTHYLVSYKYIREQSGVIDRENTVLYPYQHNYTDTEFTQTAMSRGVYAYCQDSKLEHMHPAWGKAKLDETYIRGGRTQNADKNLFEERKHLWNG